jgi:hypothetical protein
MPRRTPAEASSTGYVPANEGREYVVLSPTDSADAFEVTTVLAHTGLLHEWETAAWIAHRRTE